MCEVGLNFHADGDRQKGGCVVPTVFLNAPREPRCGLGSGVQGGREGGEKPYLPSRG